MILVLAGNHRQATEWAREKDLSSDEWRYVRDVHDLYGHDDAEIVHVGQWCNQDRGNDFWLTLWACRTNWEAKKERGGEG